MRGERESSQTVQGRRWTSDPADASGWPISDRSAISLQGVVKRYGSIVAVDGLDLEVPPAVCFGLLGPNGAGKSTTMRMLTAQTLADEGRIRVLGFELQIG